MSRGLAFLHVSIKPPILLSSFYYSNFHPKMPLKRPSLDLQTPQISRLNKNSHRKSVSLPLTAAAGVPLPPLDLTEDNVREVLADARDEFGHLFDTSIGMTEVHALRLQALKALAYSSTSNSGILSRLYEIVFGILDKVGDAPQKRKKGVFGAKGGDKESVIRSNLQYAALSALRRLPLDPGNPAFLHRAVQGVSFSDPIAVRHALEIISELATKDLYAVAMSLANTTWSLRRILSHQTL